MANQRHAYFFPHPLRAADTPGRVPFAVEGTLLGADGARAAERFEVFADGYGKDLLGRNQDPCVFASPVPLLHAFCRLDAKGGKHYVEDRGRCCLSQMVKPGDIVFYGSLRTARGEVKAVFFDTVMVVKTTWRWPTVRERGGGKPYRLLTDDASLAKLGTAIFRIPTPGVFAFEMLNTGIDSQLGILI
jgi:hypothetical protein